MNRTKMKVFSMFLIVAVIMIQCKHDKTVMMPNVTGAINEVLLVLDKAKWDDRLGVEYLNILAEEQVALNQSEPIFDVLRMPPQAFTDMFKKHRAIIINNVGTQYSKPKIIIQHNQWARTQLVFNIFAPDDSSAIKLLENNGEMIVSQLNQAERTRLMELNKNNPERGIYKQLMNKHKLGIYTPSGYKLDVDTTDFVWLSLETPGVIQGVLIYHYNFEALKPINPEFLIAKRNEFTKKYVPGGPPGSYMTTETLISPVYSENLYKDRQYYEIKGLWTLEKGFMGGPFISLTTVDKTNKRIVTAEGYVFAPNKDKKNYIRQLEAIIYSLELPDDAKE